MKHLCVGTSRRPGKHLARLMMLLLAVCMAGPCHNLLAAQTTYSISGAAYYSPGKYNYLPDGAQAFVKLVNSSNTVVQVVRANGIDGSYTFTGVANGTYTLVASTNDSTSDRSPIAPLQYPFLSPASGSQTVTVNGASLSNRNFTFQYQCTCGGGVMTSGSPLPPGYSSLPTNGDVSGWGPFTENPANVSCDSTPDRDGTIQSTGRDLGQFTWTYDATNLYGFTVRLASETNTDNFIYYADLNNNGVMESTDAVIYVGWQGGNRTVAIYLGKYTPANPAGDPMNGPSGYADGYSMPGTIQWVRNVASAGYGSQSGIAMQWYIPWSMLGVPSGTAIRWHISSLNSTVTAGSLVGQIDDNMGGCGGCVATSQVGGVTLTPATASVNTQASTVVYIPHFVTNSGNGNDTMSFSYTASGSWTPSSITYYKDLGTVGTYDPGVDLPIANTGTMSAGATMPIIVAVTPPASANGAATISFKATSAFIPPCGGGAAATATTADTVTVVNYSISGTVYVDQNHNSTLDTGETWSSGPQTMFAELFSGSTPSGAPQSTVQVTTGGAGTYTFPNLTQGTYTVLITTTNGGTQSAYPNSWVPTEHAGPQAVTLINAPVTENFGLFNGSRITGVVFVDNGAGGGTPNNGVKDGSEGVLPGVTVTASSQGASGDSTTTDTNGVFTLFMPPTGKTVTITRVASGGYIATWGSVGTTGGSYSRVPESISFNAATGTQYTGLAFGVVPPNILDITGSKGTSANTTIYYPHIFTAQSNGSVTFSIASGTNNWTRNLYLDTNCNSVLDAGETQISGAITFPRTAGSQPSTMQACILLQEVVPTGIAAGVVDTVTINAVEAYAVPSPPWTSTVTQTDTTTVGPTISGTVYADVNHNGILDLGEIGTNTTLYVKAFLNGTGAPSLGSVNPDTGSYSIPVSSSGTYKLVLSTNNSTSTDQTPSYSAGWIPVAPNPGTVTGATAGNTYNFGLFNGSTLAGTVFVDIGSGTSANNGQINSGEPGYAGLSLTVSYTGGSGSPQTVTTDGNGAFSLWISGSVTNVTVTRPVIAGYLGTGGAGGAGGVTGGTYTRGATTATDTVTISTLNGVQFSGIRFGVVPVNLLTNSNSGTAGEGTTIYYPHEFTAGSAGSVSFAASGSWPEVVLYDQTLPASCSGSYSSNYVAVPSSIAVSTNQKLCLLVRDAVPLLASGTNTITLTATQTYSNASPALASVLTRTDITTVMYLINGTVYSDINHSSVLDSSEGGTGLSLYMKLVPQSATSASSVVAVNTGTGAGTGTYNLYALPGTYRVVLSTNNDPNDITVLRPAGWLPMQNPTGQLSFTVIGSGVYSQDFGFFNGSTLSGVVFIDNGSGGAIANNGVREAGESYLQTVSITATNGATSYDTATTAADGTYQLYIPATATSVTITRVAQSGYLATGGSAGTTGGTYNRAAETVAFTLVSGSVYTGVNFGDVPVNTVSDTGTGVLAGGGTLYYAHTFVAGSQGTVTFSVSPNPTPSLSGWTEVVLLDSNCTHVFDGSQTQVIGNTSSVAIPVATAGTVCVLVKETAPSSGQGQNVATLTASFNYENATGLSSSVTRTDTTSTGNVVTLSKVVDKVKAYPGDVLTYTITYTNEGVVPATNMVIMDLVDPNTTFITASCGTPLPDSLTACSVSGPTSGVITYAFTGTLDPSANGTVTLKLAIK